MRLQRRLNLYHSVQVGRLGRRTGHNVRCAFVNGRNTIHTAVGKAGQLIYSILQIGYAVIQVGAQCDMVGKGIDFESGYAVVNGMMTLSRL